MTVQESVDYFVLAIQTTQTTTHSHELYT